MAKPRLGANAWKKALSQPISLRCADRADFGSIVRSAARRQKTKLFQIQLRDRIFVLGQFVAHQWRRNVEISGNTARKQPGPLQLFETRQVAQLFQAEMIE